MITYQWSNSNLHGFTLVEVLVSMSLMAIITFVSLLVFSNVNKQSTSLEELHIKEATIELLNETIRNKKFYNDKVSIDEFVIRKSFSVVENANSLGLLELEVLDKNDQTVFTLNHYVQLEK